MRRVRSAQLFVDGFGQRFAELHTPMCCAAIRVYDIWWQRRWESSPECRELALHLVLGERTSRAAEEGLRAAVLSCGSFATNCCTPSPESHESQQ